MIAHILFINIIDTFRSTGWKQSAGKYFEFSKVFFPGNDILECAYYLFWVNKFT